jgi:hypothetical protein
MRRAQAQKMKENIPSSTIFLTTHNACTQPSKTYKQNRHAVNCIEDRHGRLVS